LPQDGHSLVHTLIYIVSIDDATGMETSAVPVVTTTNEATTLRRSAVQDIFCRII
jgi:hypothetical protein